MSKTTVAELINRLATQGGIDSENEGLKALLSNAALTSQTIDDEMVNAINSNLLTVESAKNNSQLKNHFTALALGGVDSELSRLQGNYDFTPETLESFKNEPSSYKRIGMMVAKVQELESAKMGQSQNGKDALQLEIDKLNQSILNGSEAHKTEIHTLNQTHRGNMQNLLVQTALSGYDYSLPTSKEVAISTAENIVFGELAKQGGTVILDDNNNLVLKQKANPEMDFYINNVKADFKGFTESTLATHKLLKTIETPPAQGMPQGAPQGTPPATAPNSFAASIERNISDLEGATK